MMQGQRSSAPKPSWISRARQARADGQHDRAVACWREALRDAPDDWRSALELAADLRSTGHYSESDAQFRQAARSLPDGPWLAHYAGLFTFHTDDLPWLESRARATLLRRPDDAELHRLLGDVLLQRRQWRAAERHLHTAHSETAQAKGALAGLYARLARTQPADAPPYAVAVVNLDRNPGRLRSVRRAFRASRAPLFRIPGVLGSLLPEPAAYRLGGAQAAKERGTLGCFLSHALAWETMLARGLSHCLIIEDDVVPLLRLPAGLGSLGLPDGFDICFVNDRLQPRWPVERIAGCTGFACVPLAEAMATFGVDDNAPGMDGYVLSAAGARKLLAWVAEDGFAHDVDWRVLAYGLTGADIGALRQDSHAWGVLDALRHGVGRADRLHACVLHPALIRTVPISSDREDGNRHHHGPTLPSETDPFCQPCS